MLDGWYCRSVVANAEGEDDEDDEEEEESQEEGINYKAQYRSLKRKLKDLIYENECFQEALRNSQRRLLKIARDRSFLLDRLLQYEKLDITSSESEETESSDDGEIVRTDQSKRRKVEQNINNHTSVGQSSSGAARNHNPVKKKRPQLKTPKQNSTPPVFGNVPVTMLSDGHMTPEEVERHLESRQSYLELVPEKALPTVPAEMFSNDPSLDSESNEIFELETSPSNMGEDCLSVDMIAE
ncbi:uncharacterized protein LOC124546716 [Schistocerca americana]|uniref:uncharacterized protein LOC124546716 n=1 Tax=Schistocerca americana TaxID=7009 RepID=UPI001F4FD885|nr:uncharacterized protein LOC124546716 [Schistocerca americana]XP_047114632.1 uncharacterized protein LOC124794957 [Schistocerca piceifrons]XP_049830066.1 uncharacterized protein LOC126270903 [Schistocerca gregaria]XP_049951368.1 uncharacterized protein LOC126458397 [Schistocerca serialis cubense]